ncbi:Reverse transcriptase (RNA-dependent DNA polymerase) [Pseudomonas syringae]|uniref:reverse transcriptase family protein n=1 Tax=Pseudomonas syringae TaxID=317 RepID=UPI00089619FA|nr:reverse transcriptase family protein [Pseudomonas syringae]SDX08024.1 Reverse transcriptase (RNA-dependent DNA polymerase) [Pseudomonas syringae]SFM25635.1 Reverse transcriptase (RNA-dependent DNA polymerase) [Pseudomonas syringae]
MTTTKINQIHSLEELGCAVGVPVSDIKTYLNSNRQVSFYRKLRIPKRGKARKGEYREVYKASEAWVAQLHRLMALIIRNSVEFGLHVQGFVDGRSTISNARQHMKKEVIMHADLKDFFNTITEVQVAEYFLAIGAHPEMAPVFARLCTIDGYLLQGTRCSPAVSNIVCDRLDSDMLRLARSTSSVFTRYADNLTFSGDNPPSAKQIEGLVEANGFKIRGTGCYSQHRGSRLFVTGLSVVDQERPRLPKQMKKRLRLIAYYVGKYGEDHFEHSEHARSIAPSLTQLEGLLAYAYSVEPQFARKIWAMLN